MPILDFKEIAQANKATGMQDDFELFCRDFFNYLGYEILTEPSRGQDGGIDLLAQETRTGIGGKSCIKWLVSCKHNAHSQRGKSVGTDDEVNILDRVESNGCNGFIGAYSTIASAGLTSKLKGLAESKKLEFQIFNRGKIEETLFRRKEGIDIALRFFPKSMKIYQNEDILTNSDQSIINLIGKRQGFYEEYLQRKRKEKD